MELSGNTIPLSRIKPNPENPRVIHDDKFKKLCKSLADFPQMMEKRPIVVDENWMILGGNMRFRALKENGLKAIPVEWVSIAEGWTDEQKKEFVIKDNAGFGDWDWDALANWDVPLADWGVDVPDWGADGAGGSTEAKEDDFDEENETIVCRCKKGDIWQCGEHRVMCGDSTQYADVEKLMGGGVADMLFTDPPYNVNIEQKKKKILHCNEYNAIANDNLPMNEFKSFLGNVFENANRALKDTASYYVFTCQGGDNEMMMMMMREKGLKCRHQIIWVKDSPVFSMGRLDYDYKHEPILYGWKKSHHFYRKGEQDKSVWEYKRTENKIHPTMKPVELIANALHNSSKEGDLILDLFGGSGSTMIACEQTGRKCVTMEYDEHYCDVILARWEKLTGREAVKLVQTT